MEDSNMNACHTAPSSIVYEEQTLLSENTTETATGEGTTININTNNKKQITRSSRP